jgi:hypothetical protein
LTGLTIFLYQLDGEIIAFARPDLAVAGTGSSSVAQVADKHLFLLKNLFGWGIGLPMRSRLTSFD